MALARVNLTANKLKLMTMAPLGFVGLSAGTLLLAAAAMNWVEGKLPPAYHIAAAPVSGETLMVSAPKDRIEIVLMNNQPNQTHLWVQSNAELARRYEFDKDKSFKIIGGAVGLFMLLLYISPATAIISLLVCLIILFPLSIVGMAGYFQSNQL